MFPSHKDLSYSLACPQARNPWPDKTELVFNMNWIMTFKILLQLSPTTIPLRKIHKIEPEKFTCSPKWVKQSKFPSTQPMQTYCRQHLGEEKSGFPQPCLQTVFPVACRGQKAVHSISIFLINCLSRRQSYTTSENAITTCWYKQG